MPSLLNITGHQIVLPPVSAALGENLYTSMGDSYVDLEAGVWCLSLGHNHKGLEQYLQDRKDELKHAGYVYTSEITEMAAAAVCSFAGLPDGECVFLSSGSEAIELALQIVDCVAKPTKIATLPKAYFGSYKRTNLRDSSWWELPWHADLQDRTADLFPTGSFAFLFEPGSAAGEVRFPDAEYVAWLETETKRRGGLVVVNEVTTGAGRTGLPCAYQHFGLAPDIVILGKGIGNGYPVSAVVVNKQIARALHDLNFGYMQSHQNDPLAASIASYVTNYMESERLPYRAGEKGKRLLVRLAELEKYEVIKEVRGRGLMIGIDFKNADVCRRIHSDLLDAGFVTTNRGRMIRLDPPLTVKDGTLEAFADKFRSLL